MGTAEAYKLDLLDKSFIEEIIKTKAFSSKDVSPDVELVKMVGDMAKRCVGSPLAATALGSILRTKHSVEEWSAVLSRSTICDEETGILPILKLSYNDLPSQMRQCFSFCAMFPKDYEIDRDMLIQLWMANGFIMEQQGVCPEIRGKQIFIELASRSFFQDVKEIPFDPHISLESSKFRHCSRITCKIHDLMHDVAQSAVGKECATIATKPSKSGDFPYSTRHLFVPLEFPKNVLKGFLEKSSPALQTLLCTRGTDEELQYLSKLNSIKALTISKSSFLKPKYLHHLRYLNLSGSRIEALPEDISILYHLQTLDLSGCERLAQLPKEMKYMAALRHIYTHGCSGLKMMPAELGCLTFLRTLTSFVAGTTGSSCSNLGGLALLDLGDQLEIRQLENVTETDAQAANLGNKRRLTELIFTWTDPNREPQHYHKVLEGLKPHDGIKVLRIFSYGGYTYPTWINTLQHMVELVLSDCNEIKKLPPLCQLPALQVLCMSGMDKLHCFCGGGPPFTFKRLKELGLCRMPNFETWWDINELHGQDPIFPEVEKLSIRDCKKLVALPRATLITESSAGRVSIGWRSSFPALKELELYNLMSFRRWEAVEGTPGEQVTFPWLENLLSQSCPELTTLPEAPKLSELWIEGGSQQICLHAARYFTSLSTLKLSIDNKETALLKDHSLIKLVDDKEKWRHESSLRVIMFSRCDFLFTHSTALVLWNYFVQLEDLEIENCDTVVHWPENVFQRLVSLRKLTIRKCNKLTGCTQASEQSTPGHSVLPPCLESLELAWCDSLVEVPVLPASQRALIIESCHQLESILLRKQQNARLGSGDGVLRQEKSAVIPGSCNEAMASTAVPNLSSSIPCLDSPGISAHYCVPQVPKSPSITFLQIALCSNLQSISVQLDCTNFFVIGCGRLKSLDDLPPLEGLHLYHCCSLESIPDMPQAYSSLRYLGIRNCPRLKVLPLCLKQQLNDIDNPYLDACYTGPKLSRPSTWKYAISKHC